MIEFGSARFNGILDKVNVSLRRRLATDSEFRQHLGDRMLEIRVPPVSEGPSFRDLLRDITRFISEQNFALAPRRQLLAFEPELSASPGAKFFVADGIQHVSVQPSASSFDPQDLVQGAAEEIDKKRRQAREYATRAMPLWLALYITDRLGVTRLSLDRMEACRFALAPFERIFVGEERDVLQYSLQV